MTTEPTTQKGDAEEFDAFAGGEINRTAPVTPEQEELWLAVQLGGEPANLAYNQATAVHLEGDLDAVALRDALDTLVCRHEALRTTLSGDGSLLRIAAQGKMTLLEQDLSALPCGEREEAARAARERLIATPFDLVRGPLAKAMLLRLAEREHLLFLCAHHLVQDGWSASLLVDELGKLYSAARRGETPELPAAFPFGDYATLRAEEALTEAAQSDLAFWRARFENLPPPLDLPLDHPRPAERRFESDRVDLAMPEQLVARLKESAATHGVSLATLLFAAFQIFVARVSGQSSLAIVMPLAGQSIAGRPSLVGHCVRSLPILCEIDPELQFVEHLSGVKRALLDAIEHPRVTFGDLIKELSIARDPSRIPLAPIMFDVESRCAPEFHGLEASLERVPRRHESFELFVSVEVRGSEAAIEAQFNSALFERASIERRLGEYRALLEDVVTNPHRRVGDLELMTETEREELRAAMHGPRTEPPSETLCALFRDNAVKTPGTTAVCAGNRTLSYSELDRASAALAQELVARGVGPGSLVGVFSSRSIELVVALLGILRSGAAYVPLDPNHPRERLAFIVEDAKLAVVVTEQALATFVPSGPRCFIVNAAREDATSDLDNSRLEDPAYVIYTSGSSGRPQGVVVDHRNLSNLLTTMARKPGFGPNDVLLAVTTPSFDLSVPELFLPLAVGGKVAIASQEDLLDGRRLGSLLASSKATLMQATPACWRLLIDAGWSGEPTLTALVGGEALGRDLATMLRSRSARLFNCYGPTEATVWATMEEVQEAQPGIGRPLPNVSAYVLDARLRLVPPGVIGQLYLGGAGVVRGYLDRPELTRERFVPDPFSPEPNARMYRTGDLARFTNDGRLEWLWRDDFQVKLRGHRIELGEVVARLAECSGIRESVAMVREDADGDRRIVAYVRPEPGADPSEPELRAELRGRLPPMMVPRHFVILESFPLTLTGKIDHRALPAPDASRGAEQREPITDVEREIAHFMCELLRVGRIARDDDFFALGGHSMSALRLCARIRASFGVDVPVRFVFARPTLEAIASFVEAGLLLTHGSGVRVASPGQEREEVLL